MRDGGVASAPRAADPGWGGWGPRATKLRRFRRWRRPGGLRSGRLIPGNRVALLHDGEECFPAMLADIARAQREIFLEMYWFGSDRTGQRFAAALADAARRGLDVRVIYDGVGSYDADTAVFEGMRAAGCQVFEYNPIAPWRRRFRLDRINHRNHRKILVIDGGVAYTGGINFADQWASRAEEGGAWRDDVIRVEGPAAQAMRDLVCRILPEVSDADPACTRANGSGMPRGSSAVRVLANDYRNEVRAIRRAYLRAIRHAKVAVLIANSYFIPDRQVRRELAAAVRRGVQVRVLLPGLSDVAAVRYASQHLYGWLLRRGIRIYEWNDSVLHSKSAVVDDRWCTVGTFNLDYRSWQFNLEVNVAIEDGAVAQMLRARLEEDIAVAAPVDLHTWHFRPLLDRLLQWLCYRFRKLL